MAIFSPPIRYTDGNRGGRQAAFTLLEVLIAMAVAAILFLSVSSICSQQLRTQSSLIRKSAADQLAWNLLEMYHLQGMPTEPLQLEGKKTLGGFDFNWRQQIERQADSGEWHLTLWITEHGESLIRQDWLWFPKGK